MIILIFHVSFVELKCAIEKNFQSLFNASKGYVQNPIPFKGFFKGHKKRKDRDIPLAIDYFQKVESTGGPFSIPFKAFKRESPVDRTVPNGQ